MGENPEILEEVAGWVMSAAGARSWAKMTPNIRALKIQVARVACRLQGVSAINTIRSVMG